MTLIKSKKIMLHFPLLVDLAKLEQAFLVRQDSSLEPWSLWLPVVVIIINPAWRSIKLGLELLNFNQLRVIKTCMKTKIKIPGQHIPGSSWLPSIPQMIPQRWPMKQLAWISSKLWKIKRSQRLGSNFMLNKVVRKYSLKEDLGKSILKMLRWQPTITQRQNSALQLRYRYTRGL